MDTSKNFIINCVNDALKMEKSIYTLNEIATECESKANDIQANAEKKQKNAEKLRNFAHGSIEWCQTCIENTKKHPVKEFYQELGFSVFGSCCFASFLIGWVLLYIIFGVEAMERFYEFAGSNLILALTVFIPGLIIFPIFILIFKIKHIRDLSKELKAEEDQYEDRMKDATELFNTVRKMEIEVSYLRGQANICTIKSREIQKVLANFYTYTNVIPIDYRKIDCILIFSHVFRNDLADTIREAVSYYETCVFRDKVIRGIKNIASKIDQLLFAADAIKDEIHTMNDSVSQLVRSAETSNELQAQSIQESRATRYAVERLNYSVERYNYYRNI